MRNTIVSRIVLILIIIFCSILVTLYAPNDKLKALGSYLSGIVIVYLIAVLILVECSKFRLNKDLELQYFIGIISGSISGFMVLFASDVFLKSKLNPVTFILLFVGYIVMIMFSTALGLLVVAFFIQKRE